MSKETIIHISKNGPYVAENIDAITESVGTKVRTDREVIALCRCGQSKTKPYCDGTHGKIEWSDEKQEDRVPRKVDNYIGKNITIHDDRGICSHAGFCTDSLPIVFRMTQELWIDADAAAVDAIIETIRKCPSGALSYSIDDVLYDNFTDEKQIVLTEDGPYRVTGGIALDCEDTPTSEEHYALCRCGHSKNKPYCNGQHWYEKFTDDGKVKSKTSCNCTEEEAYDNKLETIQHLAATGKSIYKSMRTDKSFPSWEQILFKAAQVDTLPLEVDTPVNTKTIIGKTAKKPLELDIPFYVSHMSFGALSKEAKVALAAGSSLVGTAMCSGEGGMLKESRVAARKYIYELGTAPFSHDAEIIKQADAVEIKMGQAAKPGYGGSLPADKVSPEIAKIRGIKKGEEGITPTRMDGVENVEDLKKMVTWIKEVTDGKPVGIKFAAGHIEEDIEKSLYAGADFITIDCRGGATGSSPTFLKDNVCVPPIYALYRARSYLDYKKSDVTLCITGGFRDSADIAKALAMGADAVALATASMISIGCLQSKVCYTGKCPVGIATQDEELRRLFSHEDSIKGFQNFYNATTHELEILAKSMGKDNVHKLNISDIFTTSDDVAKYTDISHA
ncbi:MAG: CDGSH iron-sulfur domain-containing protein [Clostridiales bacterium]|nr:CDGSH iron-sulfur domain-containing protein [Clostridiales bacterium]